VSEDKDTKSIEESKKVSKKSKKMAEYRRFKKVLLRLKNQFYDLKIIEEEI